VENKLSVDVRGRETEKGDQKRLVIDFDQTENQEKDLL